MSAPDLKQADNGVWYIHWTEGRRSKRVSTRSKDLAAAKAFLGQWLLMEQSEAVAQDELTCGDLWDFYVENKFRKKGKDTVRADSAWKHHLSQTFSGLPLHLVNQSRIDQYVAKRALEKAADATVWLELVKLSASWNYAVRKRLIASDRLPDIELPERPGAKDRWLSREEIGKLLDTAAVLRPEPGKVSRGELFCWLALETAARKAAIEKLRWEHVDFETGIVNYAAQGFTKSKKKVAVAISDALLPVLRQAYEERKGPWVLQGSGPIANVFNRIVEKAKLKDVTPHTLRHTAATHMARNGVDIWLIAKILGNSVEMIEKVYGHHMPEASKAGVNAISGGRFRVVA